MHIEEYQPREQPRTKSATAPNHYGQHLHFFGEEGGTDRNPTLESASK